MSAPSSSSSSSSTPSRLLSSTGAGGEKRPLRDESLRTWFRGLDVDCKVAALAIINDPVFTRMHLRLLAERRQDGGVGASGLYPYKLLRTRFAVQEAETGAKMKSSSAAVCSRKLGGSGMYSNDSIDCGNSSDGSNSNSNSNSAMTSNDRNSSGVASDLSDEHSENSSEGDFGDESLSDIEDVPKRPSATLAAFSVAPFAIGYVKSVVSSALISVQGRFALVGSSAGNDYSLQRQKQQRDPLQSLLSQADEWHRSDDLVLCSTEAGVKDYDCLLCHQTFNKKASYANESDDLLSVMDALSNHTLFKMPPSLSELQDMKRSKHIVPAMLRRWKCALPSHHNDSNEGCIIDLANIPYYLPLLLRLEFSLWESFYASCSGVVSRAFCNISLMEALTLAEEDLKALWMTLSPQQRGYVLDSSKVVRAHYNDLVEWDVPSEDVVHLLVRCPIYLMLGSQEGGIDGNTSASEGSVFSALQTLQDLCNSLHFDTGHDSGTESGHRSSTHGSSWDAGHFDSPSVVTERCVGGDEGKDNRDDALTSPTLPIPVLLPKGTSTVRRRTTSSPTSAAFSDIRSDSPRKLVTPTHPSPSEELAPAPAPAAAAAAFTPKPQSVIATETSSRAAPFTYIVTDADFALLSGEGLSSTAKKKAKAKKSKQEADDKERDKSIGVASNVTSSSSGFVSSSSTTTASTIATTIATTANSNTNNNAAKKQERGLESGKKVKETGSNKNGADSDASADEAERRMPPSPRTNISTSAPSPPDMASTPKAVVTSNRVFSQAIHTVRQQSNEQQHLQSSNSPSNNAEDGEFIVVQGPGKRRAQPAKRLAAPSPAHSPRQAGYSEAKGTMGKLGKKESGLLRGDVRERSEKDRGERERDRPERERHDRDRPERTEKDKGDRDRTDRGGVNAMNSSAHMQPKMQSQGKLQTNSPYDAQVTSTGQQKRGKRTGPSPSPPPDDEPVRHGVEPKSMLHTMHTGQVYATPPQSPLAESPNGPHSMLVYSPVSMPLPPPPNAYPWPIALDDNLTRRILAYNTYVASSTRVHMCVLGELMREIQPLVEMLWKGARVQVYGSMATGLAMPFSDIDLVIQRHGDAVPPPHVSSPNSAHKTNSGKMLPIPPYNHNPSSQEVIVGLWTLSSRLQESPWVSSVSPIPRAAIPIIKLDARVKVLMASACSALAASASGEVFDISGITSDDALSAYVRDPVVLAFAQTLDTIPIDITIEAGEHKGQQSCNFVRACIASRSHVLPAVVKVLKTLLHAAGLNVPFSGGISSHSLFLMVCAAHDMYFSCSVASVPLTEGRLLLFFLELYSQHFNPAAHGIAVKAVPLVPFAFFDLTVDHLMTLGTSYWISDPFDETKNVSRASFQIVRVQLFLAEVLFALKNYPHAALAQNADLMRIVSFLLL